MGEKCPGTHMYYTTGPPLFAMEPTVVERLPSPSSTFPCLHVPCSHWSRKVCGAGDSRLQHHVPLHFPSIWCSRKVIFVSGFMWGKNVLVPTCTILLGTMLFPKMSKTKNYPVKISINGKHCTMLFSKEGLRLNITQS